MKFDKMIALIKILLAPHRANKDLTEGLQLAQLGSWIWDRQARSR